MGAIALVNEVEFCHQNNAVKTIEKFIETCEEYGRGRVYGLWGTRREDKLLLACNAPFVSLLTEDEDIASLFSHPSEFVRYITAVNALAEDVHSQEASDAIFSIRDARPSGHMSAFAYLTVKHVNLE